MDIATEKKVLSIQEALKQLLNRIDTLPWRANNESGEWTCLWHPVWKAWIDEEVANAEEALKAVTGG